MLELEGVVYFRTMYNYIVYRLYICRCMYLRNSSIFVEKGTLRASRADRRWNRNPGPRG